MVEQKKKFRLDELQVLSFVLPLESPEMQHIMQGGDSWRDWLKSAVMGESACGRCGPNEMSGGVER